MSMGLDQGTFPPRRGVPLWAALMLVLASCAPSPLPPPGASDSEEVGWMPAEAVEAPLHPYFRGLRTVELVSGSDSLTFLLDTGGGHTLLTTDAARRLGCSPFGRSVGHRMSGERVEFQWCVGVPLELGGVPLESGRVAVFDLGAILPPELPHIDGLLSLASFDDRVLTIDLPGERLVVESVASAEERRAGMQPLTARRATGEDGSSLTIFLAARAENAPVWLLLDNGNIAGTILAPHAVQQMGLGPPSPTPDDAADALDDAVMEVLGMEPRAQPVAIREVIHDGVVGEAFMRQGKFMFDLRTKEPRVGFRP